MLFIFDFQEMYRKYPEYAIQWKYPDEENDRSYQPIYTTIRRIYLSLHLEYIDKEVT